MASDGVLSKPHGAETDEISSKYETPQPLITSFSVLKERIREHYERCSDYYYSLWGEHIHHGYFTSSTTTKEQAQIQLIELLLSRSKLPKCSTVLDIGCGIGGTSRYLARHHGCNVTGITISGRQVEIAETVSAKEAGLEENEVHKGKPIQLGDGSVRFAELDAEKLADHFKNETFDCAWISEAASHFPDKALCFRNVETLLKTDGQLVIADWFKAEGLTTAQTEANIKPIEDGMLLPPLCTIADYVQFAEQAGLKVFVEPLDISNEVSKTWDLAWSLVSSPSLWALALSQGRDFLSFLQSFRAMRRGYATGTFRYAVLVFQKP